MKTSNNKLLIDLILNSPRIQLSQSYSFVLVNRDTNEPIVDVVCALKRKNTEYFPDIYFLIRKQLNLHLNLSLTRMPKRGTENLGSLSKSEKVSLNRFYSRGRTAYGSTQNLSKASGLSKKKEKKFFYKPRHRTQNLFHQ